MTAEQLGEHPSPRPRADLSSSFGPPDRASGLSGRLARPSRPVGAPTSSTSAPAAEEAAGEKTPPQLEPSSQDTEPEAPLLTLTNQAAPRSARPPNRVRAAAPKRIDAEGGTVTPIVYLPAGVPQGLPQARPRSGQTYPELLPDPLDAPPPRLTDLLATADRPQ